jgi:hypothetical protein
MSCRSSANTSAEHRLGLCRTVCLTPTPAVNEPLRAGVSGGAPSLFAEAAVV